MTADVSVKSLVSDLTRGKITRRQAIAMATAAGLAAPAFSLIAAVPGVAAQATPNPDAKPVASCVSVSRLIRPNWIRI